LRPASAGGGALGLRGLGLSLTGVSGRSSSVNLSSKMDSISPV
jgi:hypothetical protein